MPHGSSGDSKLYTTSSRVDGMEPQNDRDINGDDGEGDCQEEAATPSIGELQDLIAALAFKMERHAAQEHEAFTLVVENAKLLSELRHQRSLRAAKERTERAELLRRSRELTAEISAEQERNAQLEMEIESEKNRLRRATALAKVELDEKMKKFEDSKEEIAAEIEVQKDAYKKRIASTLAEINDRRDRAIELLKEQESHEQCVERLVKLRESCEAKLHGLDAEIASYKEDIRLLRMQLRELNKEKRKKPPKATGTQTHLVRRPRRAHVSSQRQHEYDARPASWDRSDPLADERRQRPTEMAHNSPIEIPESDDELSPIDDGPSISESEKQSDTPSQRGLHMAGDNSASLVCINVETDTDGCINIESTASTSAAPPIFEESASNFAALPTSMRPGQPGRQEQSIGVVDAASSTDLEDAPIDAAGPSRETASGQPAKRRALYHDPNPTVAGSPLSKKPKIDDPNDTEDKRITEYLESLWSLIQKRAPTSARRQRNGALGSDEDD